MNRILLVLVGSNYVLVILTAGLGLLSDPPANVNDLGNAWFRYHFLMGFGTAIFTMFVHCIVFTYFLGTTRWVKETSAAYSLGDEWPRRSRACRAKAMGFAIVSILLVVGTAASGAGAHTKAWPLVVHQMFPAMTYVFMIYAYQQQYDVVTRHMVLTDQVMDEVNRMRRARGLPLD